tara:strand:+ start:52 stop:522 length:471 start_codon:yes stop_codon:yes gene_type:complete
MNKYAERTRDIQKALIETKRDQKELITKNKDSSAIGGLIRLFRDQIRRRTSQDLLAERMETKRLIQSLESDGSVWVEIWGMSCDLVESTSVHEIPSGYYHFKKLQDEVRDNAEGRCSVRLISSDEAKFFEMYEKDNSYKDHIAEAFDNGNGTRVLL